MLKADTNTTIYVFRLPPPCNLDKLEPGTNVWVKTNPQEGAPGIVIGDAEEPESKIVQQRGQQIRRNRKQLAKVPEEDQPETTPDEINETPNSNQEAQEEITNTKESITTRSGRVEYQDLIPDTKTTLHKTLHANEL